MYWSGAVTGMILTAAVHRQTLRVLPQIQEPVCFGAVAGSAMLRTVAVLIATASPRPAGATASASVWPYSEFFPKKKARK